MFPHMLTTRALRRVFPSIKKTGKRQNANIKGRFLLSGSSSLSPRRLSESCKRRRGVGGGKDEEDKKIEAEEKGKALSAFEHRFCPFSSFLVPCSSRQAGP